jgi:hypothetical protein
MIMPACRASLITLLHGQIFPDFALGCPLRARQVKDHLAWVEPMSGMVFEAPHQKREPIAKPG